MEMKMGAWCPTHSGYIPPSRLSSGLTSGNRRLSIDLNLYAPSPSPHHRWETSQPPAAVSILPLYSTGASWPPPGAQCCLRRGAVLSLKRNLSGGDDSLVQVLCPTAKGIGSEVRGSNPDSATKGCVILGKSSTFSEPVSYSIKWK